MLCFTCTWQCLLRQTADQEQKLWLQTRRHTHTHAHIRHVNASVLNRQTSRETVLIHQQTDTHACLLFFFSHLLRIYTQTPQYTHNTHTESWLASVMSAQGSHHNHPTALLRVCVCWDHSYKTGRTAKINKYERVELCVGKSLHSLGHPHSVIVFLFKPSARPHQTGGAELEQGEERVQSHEGADSTQHMKGAEWEQTHRSLCLSRYANVRQEDSVVCKPS